MKAVREAELQKKYEYPVVAGYVGARKALEGGTECGEITGKADPIDHAGTVTSGRTTGVYDRHCDDAGGRRDYRRPHHII